MQRIMQNNAAVFRTQETLEEGIPVYEATSQKAGVVLSAFSVLSPIYMFTVVLLHS